MSLRTSIIISFWMLTFTALICVCERGSRAAGPFYVSATASSGGDGSFGNPWKLSTICAGDPNFNNNPQPPAAIVPGVTIYLRGGTPYQDPATPKGQAAGCYFSGTSGNPIKMMPYPGERVTIDRNYSESSNPAWSSSTTYASGAFVRSLNKVWKSLQSGNLNNAPGGQQVPPVDTAFWTQYGLADWEAPLLIGGSYVWVIGMEIANTNTDRTVSRPEGLVLKGVGTKAINNIIHDNCDGVWPEATALGAEVYGNIVFNNGTTEQGASGTCHGMYMQNSDASQPKLITLNLIFDNYSLGLQAYASNSDVLRGFTYRYNAVYSNGTPVGAFHEGMILGGNSSPANMYSLTVDTNYFHGGGLQVGYGSGTANNDATVTNNIISGSEMVVFRTWVTITLNNNTVQATSSGFIQVISPDFSPSWSWNNNSYFGTSTLPFLTNGGNGFENLANWRIETTFDAASTYTNGVPSIAPILRANAYDNTKTYIIIFNFTDASTVSVDVSSRLNNGDTYALRNPQDYYGTPVLTGTYSGSNLTVPMTGLSVQQPYGGAVTVPFSGPRFATFVLDKTTASSSAAQATTSGGVKLSGAATIHEE